MYKTGLEAFIMRQFKWLLLLVLTLIPGLAFSDDLGPMRLSLIEGGVQVQLKDTAEVWTPAEINTPMGVNDRLWIPDEGRAELQVWGGEFVRVDGGSSLDILRTAPDSLQLYTGGGHIYVNNRRGGINILQVDTPLTSVRGYDNSVFLVDVTGGETAVQVLKGTVIAENRLGSTKVEAGRTLSIRDDGSAEVSPMGPPDDWESWNIDRDRDQTAWNESSRYLPAELDEYSPDFGNYGRWDYDGEYGYVWFPTVAPDWAPYRDGRWGWAGGRYVWISNEPWGWAPYHYGRWSFRSGRGWCWVPPAAGSVYWAPGYVGWVREGDTVGWVPLAPGETYYGYGNYGPHSVNMINIDINTVRHERFRNAEFPHGSTFVHREDFGGRGRRFVEPPKRAFTGNRSDFRPPRTEPGREVIMRHETPIGQRPPERVINVRPERVREERPLVRERERSVMRPQEPKPQQLAPARVKEPKAIVRGFQKQKQKEKPRQKENRQEDRGDKKERRQER